MAGHPFVYDDVPWALVFAGNAVLKEARKLDPLTQECLRLEKIAWDLIEEGLRDAEGGVASIRMYRKSSEE